MHSNEMAALRALKPTAFVSSPLVSPAFVGTGLRGHLSRPTCANRGKYLPARSARARGTALPTTASASGRPTEAQARCASEFSVRVEADVRGRAAPITGTAYFAVPGTPEHLVEASPAAHPRDGDGYVLAISFAPIEGSTKLEAWARGRFVRTRPFCRERRARKRLYKGRYGTPGARGMGAPLKPKQASNTGVVVWGHGKKRKLIVFGDGGLPMKVDIATLATKGPTALGTVLSDSQELADVRGQEICAEPVVTNRGTLAVCSRSRTSTGRSLGIFMTEIDENFDKVQESPRVPLSADEYVSAFAVSESHYIAFICNILPGSGVSSNPLAGLFRGQTTAPTSPTVDAEKGTKVLLIPRTSDVHDLSSTNGGARPPKLSSQTFKLPNMVVTSCARASSKYVFDGSTQNSISLTLDLTVLEGSKGLPLSKVSDGMAGSASAVCSLMRFELNVPFPTADGESLIERDIAGSMLQEVDGSSAGLMFHLPSARLGIVGNKEVVVSPVVEPGTGKRGVAVLDVSSQKANFWIFDDLSIESCISRPSVTSEGNHAVVLISGTTGASSSRIAILDVSDMASGPVATFEIGVHLSSSVGDAWSDDVLTWKEYGQKRPTSAYELFEEKNWNDIDSGFSSLGLTR